MRQTRKQRQITVIIALVLLAGVWLVFGNPPKNPKCERAGGTWYCGYKSSCICIKTLDLTSQ